MHCVLIYNPVAGRNRPERAELLRELLNALSNRGHKAELLETSAPGTATNLARYAVRSGAEVVFACGGDGTVHEVLQGLTSETGVPSCALGILPFGSANALARHLRVVS